MNTIKENVKFLMDKLDFPTEAQEVLLGALDTIGADKVAFLWLTRLMDEHNQNINCNYDRMLADFVALCNTFGIHEYTAGMLLYLCLGEKLRERYLEKGIDESIYYKSMYDLRYKLEECRLVYGIVGTFVAFWYPHFFKMDLFAFKRLQFEIITFSKEYKIGDTVIPAGSKALNMHIPRTGTKLDREDVLESYREAAEFFADQFTDQPMIFTCASWMLDPFHETVLPPTSNLVLFYRDFATIETGVYKDYKGLWRVFDRYFDNNPDEMPADTTLRRAYIERVKRGEPTCWTRGVFFWEDGKIVTPK